MPADDRLSWSFYSWWCRWSPDRLGSISTAPEELRDPPPLIALEPRLIVCRMSVVFWVASDDPSRISSTKSLYSIRFLRQPRIYFVFRVIWCVMHRYQSVCWPTVTKPGTIRWAAVCITRSVVGRITKHSRVGKSCRGPCLPMIASLDPSTAGGVAGPPIVSGPYRLHSHVPWSHSHVLAPALVV